MTGYESIYEETWCMHLICCRRSWHRMGKGLLIIVWEKCIMNVEKEMKSGVVMGGNAGGGGISTFSCITKGRMKEK